VASIDANPIILNIGVFMQKILAFTLVSSLLSFSASAGWEDRISGEWNKFAICSSNTGTDGDLLFEVPVVLQEETSTWRGENSGNLKDGDSFVRKNILISDATKSGWLADVTDVSPMTEYALTKKKTRFSDSYDLSLPKAGYRIVIASTLNEAGELVAADAYRGEIGVSNCSLSDSSYNDGLE
jgi:hypothetical protein